jgi:hypothetical protein
MAILKCILALCLLFVAGACKNFESKKISSETILEEELHAIKWNDVDTYPVFKTCDSVSEKETLKSCFENTLITAVYNSISVISKPVPIAISDTIPVYVTISKDATLSIKNIAVDSIISTHFPEIKSQIYHSIDSLTLIAPAYKRGIPVTTEFILPVVIVTN